MGRQAAVRSMIIYGTGAAVPLSICQDIKLQLRKAGSSQLTDYARAI
jgi:hypothetical protein